MSYCLMSWGACQLVVAFLKEQNTEKDPHGMAVAKENVWECKHVASTWVAIKGSVQPGTLLKVKVATINYAGAVIIIISYLILIKERKQRGGQTL